MFSMINISVEKNAHFKTLAEVGDADSRRGLPFGVLLHDHCCWHYMGKPRQISFISSKLFVLSCLLFKCIFIL